MEVIEYRKPMVPLEIEELGDIIDIGWLPYYRGENLEQLYILAQKESNDKKTNTLYRFDINEESMETLHEYTPHPILDHYIYTDTNLGTAGYHVALLADEGVVHLRYNQIDYKLAEQDLFYFDNYHRIDSFSYGYEFYYTVPEERVLYKNTPYQETGMFDFITNPSSLDDTRYMNLTDKVITNYRGYLYFTRKIGNNNRLFRQFERNKAELVTEYLVDYKVANHPVILTQGKQGFYLQYELMYVNEKKPITSNTDKLGYSTSFSAATQMPQDVNRIIYTEFDEHGLGNLILLKANTGKDQKWRWETSTNEKTLVANQPIVGKVSLSNNGDKVLFFKLENEEIRIKTLNISSKQETDITEILYKAASKMQ